MDAAATILAVASPPGRSLRGIIRLSGAQTFELLAPHLMLSPKGQGPGRGLHLARLQVATFNLPVVALVFAAPHSYTGEDSLELQLPGNPLLLERIVDELLDSAREKNIEARRAHPGEFTARAFLNGRISLTQAEGVAATIAAQSDAELHAAQLLTSGALGSIAHALANDLAGALALVEAGIDFTDQEDVIAISPADLHDRLRDVGGRIADQLAHSVGVEQLQAIPWVVLVGEPNAGKSALFNALLGRERAVVSPTAGTTRDVLTEPLMIATDHGPAEVMLVDLAGLDEGDASFINRQMQALAQAAIARAELVLRCVPVGEVVPERKPCELVVRTKCDLKPAARGLAHEQIKVSAFTGEGLHELRGAIGDRLADRAVSLAAGAIALRPRHEAALRSALANLEAAIELVEPLRNQRVLPHPELIAAAMRAALDDLAALAGDITPDEVLGRVFASFCVGK